MGHPSRVGRDSRLERAWRLWLLGGGVPWTISIGAAGPDGAVGNYTALLSSADVADPTNAEIWIDVARDGSVTWGEGKPEWVAEDAPSCGPGG